MRLADLRKLAVRNRQRIRFDLPEGRECVVNEQGIAQIPGISGPMDLNLEKYAAEAQRFFLEPAQAEKGVSARAFSRDQVAAMVEAGGTESASHDEHDE